jgi:hypothetical protein
MPPISDELPRFDLEGAAVSRGGNEMHLTMGDAALSGDGFGEVPDGHGLSAKHGYFKAIVMIEVHMKGRHVEVGLIVMGGSKPFREFASMMIVHVG